MSFISFIGCSIDRHEPLRREVVWDGKRYIGHCRHCGTPIMRVGRGKWRKREEA